MALPLGLGRDQAVTMITSRGVEHRITLRLNRLEQRIDVERVTTPVKDGSGTAISLVWPGVIDCAEIVELIHEFAGLNPHASFTLPGSWNGATWEPAGPIAKWTAGKPTPVHWYTPRSVRAPRPARAAP